MSGVNQLKSKKTYGNKNSKNTLRIESTQPINTSPDVLASRYGSNYPSIPLHNPHFTQGDLT